MNTTTATTAQATTAALATTLRDRIALLAQAHAMKGIQARANPASVPMHIAAQAPRLTIVQALKDSTAVRYNNERKSALGQAKTNLGTANYIGQHNAKLGNALKGLACGDMNSLRSLKNTAKQAAIISEYSNLGKFWG
jgi:hypothetical protein